jgi:hypothetical protein
MPRPPPPVRFDNGKPWRNKLLKTKVRNPGDDGNRSLMRALPPLLLICLTLGACVTAGTQDPGDLRAAATATAATPAAAAPAAAAAKPEAPAKPKEWWEEGPVTRERASAMCWMKVEKASKGASLDVRADRVNKCVDQALKEHGGPAGSMR